MTPARNLAPETLLKGLAGGKSAAGQRPSGGDAKVTGEAFSALLGGIRTPTSKREDKVSAGGEKDGKLSGNPLDGNSPVREPHRERSFEGKLPGGTSPDMRLSGETPALPARGDPHPASTGPARKHDAEPNSSTGNDDGDRNAAPSAEPSLDALLAALGAGRGVVAVTLASPDRSTAQVRPADLAPSRPIADRPDRGAVDERVAGKRFGKMVVSVDMPSGAPAPLDRGKVAVEMPKAVATDAAAIDVDLSASNTPEQARSSLAPPGAVDPIRPPSVAPNAAVSIEAAPVGLPKLSIATGVVSARKPSTKVDFVSLTTDFEPAELRSNRAAGAGIMPSGTKEDPKTTGPSFDKTLAAFQTGATMAPEMAGSLGAGADVRSNLRRTADAADADLRFDPLAEGLAMDAVDAKVANGHPAASRTPDARSERGASSPVQRAVSPDFAAGEGPSSSLTLQVASVVGSQIAAAIPSASEPASGAPATAASSSAAPNETLRLRAGGAALKTLQIRLQPENLGTLDVTMKLVGGQLAIHLAASEASTALRLKDDAEGLKRLLTKSGFDIDEAAITITTRDASGARAGNSTPAQNAGGQTGGQGGSQGGGHESGQGSGFAGQGASSGERMSRGQNGTASDLAAGGEPAAASSGATGIGRSRNGGSVYL